MSTSSTAILVVIVALVSTIVGATIGACTNYVIAVRRERSERARDDRIHAIEAKRAARLIDAELMRAAAATQFSIEKRQWWSGDAPELSTNAWQKYSEIIAADLSDEEWLAAVAAIEAVNHIRSAKGIAFESGLIAMMIGDSIARQLAPMLSDVARGREALARLALDVAPPPGNRSQLPSR